jgi:membrane fusion protein, macrolide-specific efflux system
MNQNRSRRSVRPWFVVLLAVVAGAVIVIGITEVGTPTSSARTSKETVTAENGVVQNTVSGSGNVEPGVDQAVNFATSGTLQSVSVKVGQHVKKGQLIATLDPSADELTLEQAQESLTAAEDELKSAQEGTTTTTPVSSSTGSSSNGSSSGAGNGGSGKGRTSNATAVAETVTTTTTVSPSAVAQAQAQVDSAEATVKSAQTAVDETKLYAPVTGTVASLASTTIGQTVSSGGSSASSSSGALASGSSNSGSSTSSSSSSDSSSSSGFAQIINNKTMTMTVSLSESDISSVKVGQIATVSITALSGVELGGRVTAISPLGSDSSGVVTYDATLTINQTNPKVLPGMSATATVVTQQAQGVTLPNQALTGAGSDATVDLVKNGKVTTQPVVVGLRGSSRSQIISGLKNGQQVQITITLPALGTSSSSSSSSSSSTSLTGRFGGAGGFGGAGAAGGAGGFRARFFGGGGG